MPRRFIALLVTLALGLLLAVPAAAAQQPGKVYRIAHVQGVWPRLPFLSAEGGP
jgi:ABC-type sugar transport system substrate-binding protein